MADQPPRPPYKPIVLKKWTDDEERVLEEEMAKHASDTDELRRNIMVARVFHNKNHWDVAFRLRYMESKAYQLEKNSSQSAVPPPNVSLPAPANVQAYGPSFNLKPTSNQQNSLALNQVSSNIPAFPDKAGQSKKHTVTQVMGESSQKYETWGGIKGIGSSGRVDTAELRVAEGLCAPKKKRLSLDVEGCDSFGVPERKEMKLGLKWDLNMEPLLETGVGKIMTDEEKQKICMDCVPLLAEFPKTISDFLKEQTGQTDHVGETEIEITALSNDTLYKLRKLLDDHMMEKQKILAATEIKLANESGQCCTGNEAVKEDIDTVGGNDPPLSSYPPP